MTLGLPQGFRVAGVHCGIKRNPNKQDFALVVSDLPATAAGVYTRNLVFGAPVGFNRARTPATGFRVLAINSGNANACTGTRGDADAAEMADLAAKAVGAQPGQALVLSTGVIGEYLPMTKISAATAAAAAQLGTDEKSLVEAARGMLTTDTRHKLSGREVQLSGRTHTLLGMAKGAAMIGPNMGTMLCVLMTDVALPPERAQQLLTGAVAHTFNCISVEGHMSTSDSVLLLANGAVCPDPLSEDDQETFRQALDEVCVELARDIVDDGEGTTHLITIDINGCASWEEARKIAKTVAEGPLVKTAIAGADPNWGRIVSGAGYAGVPFDPRGVSLSVNGFQLYQAGAPVPFEAAAVSESIKTQRETSIVLDFSEGTSSCRFWTTDLTAEYVRLNADYHT